MKSQPHKAYDWFTTDDGRQIYRRVEYDRCCARSDLPSPNLVRAFAEPVKSMADGKYYDTPRELERTYRADGNPQGKEYACIGDDPLPTFKKPKPNKVERVKDIKRAIEEVQSGKVPEVLTVEKYEQRTGTKI